MIKNNLANPQIMWQPKADSGQAMKRFQDHVSRKYNVEFSDYWSFHEWTVANFRLLWAEVWQLSEIIYSKHYVEVFPLDGSIEDTHKWFLGARLNIAENLTKFRDDKVALICDGEDRDVRTITYAEIYSESCRYGAAFRNLGLETGDHVACYISNREEPIFAMIGATSLGAIWSGSHPKFGAKATLRRLKQVQPQVLITIDRFVHEGVEIEMFQKVKEIANELTCLKKIVIVPSKSESVLKDITDIKNSCFLSEFLALGCREDNTFPELEFTHLPFNHPVFIDYTSGTTNAPKCIVHGIGGLLTLFSDFCIHRNCNRDSTCLSIAPVGWSTWNWFLNTLFLGQQFVMFEGIPFYLTPTSFWDLVDRHGITDLFLTPAILDEFEKRGYTPTEKHHLSSLKTFICGGSVVKPQNFDFVYQKVKNDVVFNAFHGSTEMIGSCMVLEQTIPVYRGEISPPIMGVEIKCINDEGEYVIGEIGELGISVPCPSMPLNMWGDNDGKRFKESYFKLRNVFAMNDVGLINPVTKGIIIYGRSDDDMKVNGERIGVGEIYNVVETLPEVRECLCVTQTNKNGENRNILFLRMKNSHVFNEDFVRGVKQKIEYELFKIYVPEVVLEVADIPHNFNGKKMESIVRKIVNKKGYNPENVANPECLKHFIGISVLDEF